MLVEFNYIGALVMLIGVVIAILGAAGFWLRDWLQWRDLKKKYGSKKMVGKREFSGRIASKFCKLGGALLPWKI